MNRWIEVCKNLYDRNRIIPKPDEIDLYYHKYVGSLFYSVFDHTEAYPEYTQNNIKENKRGELVPSCEGYEGPVSCDCLLFDFDGETAQDDAWKLVLWFLDPPGHYSDTLKIYFSGNKGFHVYLPHGAFIEPDINVPQMMKLTATRIAEKLELKSFDNSLYKRTGIFRSPNSKHEKTGLFKIPLEVCEMTAPLEEIKEWAKQKRHINGNGLEYIGGPVV
jgi:hypothetical protein